MRRFLIGLVAVLAATSCAERADETVMGDDGTSTTTLTDDGFETVCWADGANTGERLYLPCTDTNCDNQGLTAITCIDLARAQVQGECFETGGYWDCTTTTDEYTGDGAPPCGPADDPASGTCLPLSGGDDEDMDGVPDYDDPDVCVPPEQTPVSIAVCDSQGRSTGVYPGPEAYDEIEGAQYMTGEELADAVCEHAARAVDEGRQTVDYLQAVCPGG